MRSSEISCDIAYVESDRIILQVTLGVRVSMSYNIRDFHPEEASAINRVALSAFDEYRSAYSDWPTFARGIGNMAALAAAGKIIVAATEHHIVGAVVYVGPGKSKNTFFKLEWPIIRMLVVGPAYRGQGIGRALMEECVRRARRDESLVLALHTTPIMKVALPMYQRMGFEFHCDGPAIFGVPLSCQGLRFSRCQNFRGRHLYGLLHILCWVNPLSNNLVFQSLRFRAKHLDVTLPTNGK